MFYRIEATTTHEKLLNIIEKHLKTILTDDNLGEATWKVKIFSWKKSLFSKKISFTFVSEYDFRSIIFSIMLRSYPWRTMIHFSKVIVYVPEYHYCWKRNLLKNKKKHSLLSQFYSRLKSKFNCFPIMLRILYELSKI